jgi:chromate transporter
VIAKFFDKYQEKPLVKSVFTCIRPVSAGLIAVAAYEVLKISVIQVFSIQRLLIFLVALVLLLRKKTSIIFVMILGAIAGILFL